MQISFWFTWKPIKNTVTVLVTLLPKINKAQAIKQLWIKKISTVHFYINEMAHKEYAQCKIQFIADLNLCSAVNTNINLIT